jgi:hypothetical protein
MPRHPERAPSRAAVPALALVIGALAVSVPSAGAAAGCRAPTRHPFPAVSGLTASHTDCASARAVAEYVQAWWQLNGVLPGWLKSPVRGHRWHCTYRAPGGASASRRSARCVSGRRVVTMTLR